MILPEQCERAYTHMPQPTKVLSDGTIVYQCPQCLDVSVTGNFYRQAEPSTNTSNPYRPRKAKVPA